MPKPKNIRANKGLKPGHKIMAKPDPVGRPPIYRKIFAVRAAKLCRLGATDVDLADFFGVNVDTIAEWKKLHKEFADSVLPAKEDHDAQVEVALRLRALGYSHEDVDIRALDGKIVKTKLMKHYPPDTTAAMFWLRNRQPEKWREVTTQRISGVKDEPVELKVEDNRPYAHLTTEQLRQMAAQLAPAPEPPKPANGIVN